MNLIDGYVTKILEHKKFTCPDDWAEPGKIKDIFVVEYVDGGGSGKTTELWFDENRHEDVVPGYRFAH